MASCSTTSNTPTNLTKEGKIWCSASSRTTEQQELANLKLNLIHVHVENIPNSGIIVYTDGSSLGNPGLAGAGYYIKFPAAASI